LGIHRRRWPHTRRWSLVSPPLDPTPVWVSIQQTDTCSGQRFKNAPVGVIIQQTDTCSGQLSANRHLFGSAFSKQAPVPDSVEKMHLLESAFSKQTPVRVSFQQTCTCSGQHAAIRHLFRSALKSAAAEVSIQQTDTCSGQHSANRHLFRSALVKMHLLKSAFRNTQLFRSVSANRHPFGQHQQNHWAGYRESRRCSRDTYPESYITKYTSIRRNGTFCCDFDLSSSSGSSSKNATLL